MYIFTIYVNKFFKINQEQVKQLKLILIINHRLKIHKLCLIIIITWYQIYNNKNKDQNYEYILSTTFIKI